MSRLLTGTAIILLLLACGRDWSLPPPPTPDDTPGQCGPDRPCTFGVCGEAGSCDETQCTPDGDCRYGLCDAGRCDETRCAGDDDCRYGLCAAGTCDMLACYADDDCPPDAGLVCNGDGSLVSRCLSAENAGPPLQGDPRALRMRDNLEAAVAFVKVRHPAAELFRVYGAGLGPDATVDIGRDYAGMWMYAFRDGASEPATYVLVMYSLPSGDGGGYYDADAGILDAEIAFPHGTRDALRDTTELADTFLGTAGCVPFARESQDSVVYVQQADGPRFHLSNWRSQSFSGDPVSGEGSISCE